MLKLNPIGWIAMILLVIGGINWALVGIWEFDLVAAIFGEMSPLARIIYILVGISAIYLIFPTLTACKIKWQETHKPHPV